MTAFTYQNGTLCADAVPLPEIAAAVGTPTYVYSATRLRANVQRLMQALPNVAICFAVKANGNQAVLTLLGKCGAGADIVSGGELARALAAGIPATRIVFSGVGKTDDELDAALRAGIHQINAESAEELRQINRRAAALGVVAAVALRVNPDVAADTHHKISTGKKGDKFGIDHEQLASVAALAKTLPHVKVCGLAVHIGSQLFDIEAYRKAYQVTISYYNELRALGLPLERLDLGGGMGVPYDGSAVFDVAAFAQMLKETVMPLGCALTIEPGRYVVADAGVLLSRVTLIKQGVSSRFVIVDAAMNDLIRPALYESYHHIRPVQAPAADAPITAQDVVGPICESSDCFAQQRQLPPLHPGDLLVFDTAGAYGAVMSSTYNVRPLVAEVLVDGTRWSVIRPRIDAATQIGWDKVPDWV